MHDDLSFGINFEDESLHDEDYWALTGLKKADFRILVHELKLRGRSWSPQNSLGVFMMKLRMGISHRELSVLFKVSVRRIHKRIAHTREAFLRVNGFVDRNLGPNHISRDQIIRDHTTIIARELFGKDILILVEDGTYIYIQKSGNFVLARHTFSVHKHRPLVKPMILCTTDGYIIAVLGPYLADGKNSDAGIFVHQFESETNSDAQALRQLIQEGDIWIVDRGFRGVNDVIPDQTIHMPSFEKDGQATTAEANHSRRVTKVRFVVECANARLKQFKFLARTVTNTQLPHIGAYTRIVAAICNKFRPPLVQSKPEDAVLARRMLSKLNLNNNLKDRCCAGGDLHSRSSNVWEPLESSHVPGFPLLTETQIEGKQNILHEFCIDKIFPTDVRCSDFITFGAYQIGQAKNYVREHLDLNGEFVLQREKFKDDDYEDSERVIHVRLQSRHISATKYHTYVQFNPQQRLAWEKIVAWYCTCSCGARTMGCCAHVTTTIWWLSVGRTSAPPKRQNLWVNLMDADLSRNLGQLKVQTEIACQTAVCSNDPDSDATLTDLEERICTRGQADDSASTESSDEDWVPLTQPKTRPVQLAKVISKSNNPVATKNFLVDTPFGAKKTADFVVAIEHIHRIAITSSVQSLPLTRATRSSNKQTRTDPQLPLQCENVSSDSDSDFVRKKPQILVQQRYQSLAKGVRLQTNIDLFLKLRILSVEETKRAMLVKKFIAEHHLLFSAVQITSIDGFPICLENLKCLLNSSKCTDMWLDDAVINAFFSLLVRKYENTCFLPTFFWQKLDRNDGACIPEFWNRLKPLATLTFIPINVDNVHWKMCVLDWQRRTASTYDPLEDPTTTVSVLPQLKSMTSITSLFGIQDFVEIPLMTNIKQPDQFNCGTTVLLLAEMICSHLALTPYTFTTTDLSHYRQRILLSVTANRLQ
jgi:hypothetical protein